MTSARDEEQAGRRTAEDRTAELLAALEALQTRQAATEARVQAFETEVGAATERITNLVADLALERDTSKALRARVEDETERTLLAQERSSVIFGWRS